MQERETHKLTTAKLYPCLSKQHNQNLHPKQKRIQKASFLAGQDTTLRFRVLLTANPYVYVGLKLNVCYESDINNLLERQKTLIAKNNQDFYNSLQIPLFTKELPLGNVCNLFSIVQYQS